MIAFLLHHANRYSKSQEFYAVKDMLLKKYGREDGYDIQHLPGVRCRSCGGRGQHPRYSNTPPYKIYDWADCYHCWGGWYKLPQWICLQRYRFGSYVFHRPLKRERCVRNPWTEDNMGWQVSGRHVVEGYIDHHRSWFGPLALLILFRIYDLDSYRLQRGRIEREMKNDLRWRWIRFKKLFTWQNVVREKPTFVKHWLSASGWTPIDPELPF